VSDQQGRCPHCNRSVPVVDGKTGEAVRCAQCIRECPDCGKPADSFACKIRHIQLNTGAAKAARD
jgi:hypothetical protein